MAFRKGFAALAGITFVITLLAGAWTYPRFGNPDVDRSGAFPADTLSAYEESIPGTLVTFQMIPVEQGVVTMPGEDGDTEVTVGPFWMSATEVTWDAYDIFAYQLDLSESERLAHADAVSRPSKPYEAPDYGFGHQGYAAICVTYHAAEQYTRWLSEKTGHNYRLATEAEWAYAARAGADTDAPTSGSLDELAWHAGNAGDKAQAVGSKSANAWGFYDMLGNVSEWVTGMDGKPVTMGGSYKNAGDELTYYFSARQTRKWNETDPQIPKSRWWLSNGPFVGFRIVREP